MPEQRFTAGMDGSGQWSVIDAENGLPAVVHGRTLSTLSKRDAGDAADLLNLVFKMRTDEPKPTATLRPGIHPSLLPVR